MPQVESIEKEGVLKNFLHLLSAEIDYITAITSS